MKPIEKITNETRARTWYYRLACQSFKRRFEQFRSEKFADKAVYLCAELEAAVNDPDVAREFIEFDGHDFRFDRFERDKKFKLKKCRCYLKGKGDSQ